MYSEPQEVITMIICITAQIRRSCKAKCGACTLCGELIFGAYITHHEAFCWFVLSSRALPTALAIYRCVICALMWRSYWSRHLLRLQPPIKNNCRQNPRQRAFVFNDLCATYTNMNGAYRDLQTRNENVRCSANLLISPLAYTKSTPTVYKGQRRNKTPS